MCAAACGGLIPQVRELQALPHLVITAHNYKTKHGATKWTTVYFYVSTCSQCVPNRRFHHTLMYFLLWLLLLLCYLSQPEQASRPMWQSYAGSETAAGLHVTKQGHRILVLRNACSHNHLLQGVGCCYYICSDMFPPTTLCSLRSKNQTTALFVHKSDDKRC